MSEILLQVTQKHDHISIGRGTYCRICGKQVFSPYWWTAAIYAVMVVCFLRVAVFGFGVLYDGTWVMTAAQYNFFSNFFMGMGLFVVAVAMDGATWLILKAAFNRTRFFQEFALMLIGMSIVGTFLMWAYVLIGGFVIG